MGNYNEQGEWMEYHHLTYGELADCFCGLDNKLGVLCRAMIFEGVRDASEKDQATWLYRLQSRYPDHADSVGGLIGIYHLIKDSPTKK